MLVGFIIIIIIFSVCVFLFSGMVGASSVMDDMSI